LSFLVLDSGKLHQPDISVGEQESRIGFTPGTLQNRN